MFQQNFQPYRGRPAAYGASSYPVAAPRRIDIGTAWQRVERCIIHLVDPAVCPVALPLRAERGLTSLRSGRPAKRFVADGFVSRGLTVACLVVPDDRTGQPLIVWADGAPIANFRIARI